MKRRVRIPSGPASIVARREMRVMQAPLRACFERLHANMLDSLHDAWPHLTGKKHASIDDDLARALDRAFKGFASDIEKSKAVKHGVERTLRARAQSTAQAFDVSFSRDMYDAIVAAYAKKHAYERGVLVDISDTVRSLVGTKLQTAIEQGLTYDEVRSTIDKHFSSLEVWQVQRIARTEVANASRFGGYESTRALAKEHGINVERVTLVPHNGCEAICAPLVAESENEVWDMKRALSVLSSLHPNCLHDLAYTVEV